MLTAAIAAIVLLSTRYKFSVFFVLLAVAAATGTAAGLKAEQTIALLKAGIGGTIEKIGLLIILGITLGILLEKSGAMKSLALSVLRRTGEARAPLALSWVGFVIGLPIFCDSGYVILSGLMRSVSNQAVGKHLWSVIALASSLYAVHCLVPPHPGITAAAGTLQADLGQVMLLGAMAAVPAAIVGYWLGKWYNRRFPVVFEQPNETIEDNADLPRPALALLPIIVPVMLIGLKSAFNLWPTPEAFWWPMVKLAGEPIVAILIGILLCLPLFQHLTFAGFNELLDAALAKSGNILLITAAGGAFGEIIKALEIGKVFGPALAESGLGLLVPFLLAAVFKTAQGSSTVAVISTAGILAPLLPSLGFEGGFSNASALLAMGAGSMVVSHTNDSYFWVVAKFSDVPMETALKTYTLVTAAMGIVSFVAVWVLRLTILN